MFSRKYGGVPAWLILLVAVGGAYLYMRHTGSSLFGGSSTDTTGTDTSTDGSGTPGDGGTPSIVYVQQPAATTTNPNSPHHPAGPPATHTITNKQRAAAIMADFRKHGLAYFKNHPHALDWLKLHAPGDYKVVTQAQKTGKMPVRKPTPTRNPPKQGGSPPRRKSSTGMKG
jgi:hypothetical protein